MGAMSRRKGAVAERELCHAYSALGFPRAHRTAPLQAGGTEAYGDITIPELPWLYVESKRAETWSWDWLRQTVDDAPAGMLPVLHFRRSNMPWWVATPLEAFGSLLSGTVP